MEKLILECRADSQWCESAPSFGVAEVDEVFLQKVRYLRAEAERLKADFITDDAVLTKIGDLVVTFHEWNENDELETVPGKESNTDRHQLCVNENEFWWEGSMRSTGERFRTESVSIDGLSPYRCHNIGISVQETETDKKIKNLNRLSDRSYEEKS